VTAVSVVAQHCFVFVFIRELRTAAATSEKELQCACTFHFSLSLFTFTFHFQCTDSIPPMFLYRYRAALTQALFALGHPGCNRYAFHFSLFTFHFSLCTLHFALCTLHFALCTCRRECGDTHLYTYKRNQGAAISDAQLARERAADAAYKDLVKRKQHLKDSVRSNKRAFEETGVEEIDSEDSLGVGMTQ